MLHVDERAEIHLEEARARGPEVDSRGPLSKKGEELDLELDPLVVGKFFASKLFRSIANKRLCSLLPRPHLRHDPVTPPTAHCTLSSWIPWTIGRAR